MLMLAVLKRLVYHHNNVAAGTWRAADFATTRTYEVEGKRLGIVGLGNIGKKVARRVQGFDMDVRYYDVLRLTEDQEDALGVRFALFSELLRTSDVVTLHVPLNDVTRKMMSTAQLAMMKRSAILINTCRGPVVDEDALHQALTSGTITAAGGVALGLTADLTKDEDSRRIVWDTVARFKGLDFVWNHVGDPGPAAVEGIDMSAFDLAVDLNLRTVLITTEAAIPEMRARGGGSLLFTASTSGLVGPGFSPVYSMCKFGVVGFGMILALRVAAEM